METKKGGNAVKALELVTVGMTQELVMMVITRIAVKAQELLTEE